MCKVKTAFRLFEERGKCGQNRKTILTCVRTLAPIASQARHFPRERGQLTPRKKEIIFFIILYTLKRAVYGLFPEGVICFLHT